MDNYDKKLFKIKLLSLALLTALLFSLITAAVSDRYIHNLKTAAIKPCNYIQIASQHSLPATDFTVRLLSIDGEENYFLFAWQKLLKQAGIPFVKCQSAKEFADAKFAIVCKQPDTTYEADTKEISFIRNFVSNGGFLIGDGLTSLKFGQLKDVLGWKECFPSKQRMKINFEHSFTCRYLDETEETELTLSTIKESIWTNGIQNGTSKSLANFNDGSCAISENIYGEGKAILLGFSLADIYLRNLASHNFQPGKSYINNFEPMSDVFILLVKAFYENTCRRGFTLYTAPAGFRSTFIMTHDVDYQHSVVNSLKFADIEDKAGIKSTFFMQTKYIRDYNDAAFCTPESLAILKSLNDRGFEIGSHSVSHSIVMNEFPYGTGLETYPDYKPFVKGKLKFTGNATLCGEVRVSKMILEGCGINVTSFRPGNLTYHRQISKALEESSYNCSSIFSSGTALTYFPYRLVTNDDNNKYFDSKIFEFPIAIEDEESPLIERLNKSIDLFRKIHNNGAATCVLIHPDLTIKKGKDKDIEFESKFLSSLPGDCWKTTMRDAGIFFETRDSLAFNYNIESGEITLNVYSEIDTNNIAFKKNNAMNLQSNELNVQIKDDFVNIIQLKKGLNKFTFKFI